MERWAAFLLCGAFLAPVLVAPAWAQGWNMELLGSLKPQATRSYNDIWAYRAPDGTELVILGLSQGISFIDVTDPRQPTEVAYFALTPTTHRDFRTYQHYAYAVNESDGGMEIFDLSNVRRPTMVGFFDETFTSAHNIAIRDGYAYVVGCQKGSKPAGTRILDLADPVNPVEVGSWSDHYVHDIHVRGDRAYCATIQRGGFTILDVADKSNPRELQFRGYSGANTHNAWLSEDGRYLLTTDETGGGHLRIWDLGNPSMPQISEWSAHPSASIHNVFVKGDSAYASYYTEGLQVIDISDPHFPIPVASYDTWPGVSGGFQGNWGVYPFSPTGNIYLSDISSGLYVVRAQEGSPVADFLLTAPQSQLGAAGQTLFFSFDIHNVGLAASTFKIDATNTHAWSMQYEESVRVPAQASDVITVFVTVPQEIAGSIHVDVELCAESQSTGRTLCAVTQVAVPVLLQSYSATHRDGAGVLVEWELAIDGAEQGDLVLLRAPAEAPSLRHERARLPLASGRFVDADVQPGEAYTYSLALDGPAGVTLLGERDVLVSGALVSRLFGNEPNPFNPVTRIRFELARPGDVSLAVYDGRGRLVRRLEQAGMAAGRQSLVWNGEGRDGRPRPSGVYFYEIESSDWRARGRMILLR
ncbi:MAG: choice-of-anchor B family protein [Candidatus Latescibacterota bacterium]|nr:MAG: choice-of-anchor B family protein [Candidatus Latescibacterota bacterium]